MRRRGVKLFPRKIPYMIIAHDVPNLIKLPFIHCMLSAEYPRISGALLPPAIFSFALKAEITITVES